ncbi:MAG: hypothetical protein KC619_32770 [Myxococcales bacterium]|nr:hypothetical protein [Myxococcales bacterium]
MYEGHRIQHRLSLYDGALERRLGVFDGARFPINDVALHPTRPLVAVGTGSYDGGHSFEGDLWLWSWESGEVRRLLGERRDVTACRWVDEDRLAVLLHPRDEEEYPGKEDEAFETHVGLVLDDLRDIHESGFRDPDPRLGALQPIEPASLGFVAAPMHDRDRRRRFDEVLEATPYEERSRVWDLMWLSPERLAATHDQCHVEVWSTRTGERTRHIRGEGHGVQLIEALGSPLVHVLRRADFLEGVEAGSTLFRIGPSGLERVRTFDRPVVLSTDGAGRLLCRDPGGHGRERADVVLSASNEEVLRADLGRYDCFNHYVRLDGQEGLYFLRGTPASSHQHKRLCRVTPSGAVEEVMEWDDRATHLMVGTACWLSAQSIVRAVKVYDPWPGAGSKLIERRELGSASPTWTLPVDAPATDLEATRDVVVFALMDGTIGILDAETGEPRWTDELEVDGVPTFATTLAVQDDTVAIGTADGRVLLTRLERDA